MSRRDYWPRHLRTPRTINFFLSFFVQKKQNQKISVDIPAMAVHFGKNPTKEPPQKHLKKEAVMQQWYSCNGSANRINSLWLSHQKNEPNSITILSVGWSWWSQLGWLWRIQYSCIFTVSHLIDFGGLGMFFSKNSQGVRVKGLGF